MPEQHPESDRHSKADDLLEVAWPARDRPIRGRELRLELAVTATFLLGLAVLIALAPDAGTVQPAAAAVVVAYALAARVEFPIGAGGNFVPTQLFLVPLFVLAPAQLVPALVFVALLLAAVGAWATGRSRLDRVVHCGGDAFHALGPAVVLTAFAGGDAEQASAGLLVLAFAAQLAADLASSSLHGLFTMGVKPAQHLRTLGQAWGVDAALTPLGLLAAWAATTVPLAALAPLPFVALLAALAADRAHRVAAAHDRMRALENERGRRQAAAQLLERQRQFLHDLSHELRTPVTIARGHLEILQHGTGSNSEAEVALDELERIERIVERLLILARADEPNLMRRDRLDAASFLEDVFARWSDTIPRQWQLGTVAEGTITADCDALRAALDALVENSVQHTAPSQAIELSSWATDGTLVIRVADEGSGIPPDALERIFERFARVDVARNRLEGGTGLGLTIVRATALAHGGTCSVESSPAGSAFSLQLPGFQRPSRASARRPESPDVAAAS
jgi:signal transduction histidine kinase